MSSSEIRLVLADPYPVMLDGMRLHMQNCPDLKVCATATDGETAWNAVLQHRPDVFVLDLMLPKRNGVDLIQGLRAEGLATKPVLFTGLPAHELMQAMDMGVQGLVSKHRPHEALLECIRQVHSGAPCLDQDLAMKTVSLLIGRQRDRQQGTQLLTPREVDVARMVTQGWPNKKIASKLAISEGTAKLHLHHIYQKLNCPGRMALMLYMQRHGY